MKSTTRSIPMATLIALLLVVVTTRAEAYELSGGMSFGWIQVGAIPHFAVGPHAGISWRINETIGLAVHDLCSMLPPDHTEDWGIYNQASVAVEHAWKYGSIGAGPSVAIFVLTTCGMDLCGRVVGVAAGGQARTDMYVAGPLGVSVIAEVDWIDGNRVLPSGMAAMVVAGPVIRWSSQ